MTREKEGWNGTRSLRLHLVEDIMQTSDEDILCQFAEDVGPPEAHASCMRARFEKTILLANKHRLSAARAGVEADRSSLGKPAPIEIAQARERLRRALADNAHDSSFMLAARKETELSDADVLDLLQVMRELGLLE